MMQRWRVGGTLELARALAIGRFANHSFALSYYNYRLHTLHTLLRMHAISWQRIVDRLAPGSRSYRSRGKSRFRYSPRSDGVRATTNIPMYIPLPIPFLGITIFRSGQIIPPARRARGCRGERRLPRTGAAVPRRRRG